MQNDQTLTLEYNDLTFHAFDQGTGTVALCLHGFPDNARSFRHQLDVLAGNGYRAVAPTLRGYEPSSQPRDGDYNMVRMAEDVIAWIDRLGEERVHLIGHDWGAVIGYAAAALAPERFHSLTTVAIPHVGRLQSDGLRQLPSQLRNSWYMAFFQIPWLSDYVVERRNWAFIERLWHDWSPGWALPAEELAHVKKTLALPGVKTAALGYYRAAARPGSKAGKRSNELLSGKTRVPTLAVTGALDGCMDSRLHDLAVLEEDFPNGFERVRIEGAGHFVHQEKPDEFNKHLLRWLERYAGSSW
jgi:pimeloyl-ACP methyl ester carboxylesterase